MELATSEKLTDGAGATAPLVALATVAGLPTGLATELDALPETPPVGIRHTPYA